MITVYFGFGSNLGDRARNFVVAQERLERAGVRMVKRSALYESEPFYFFEEDKAQPWFLNQVVMAETVLAPMDLLHVMQSVEQAVGRTSKSVMEDGKPRYAPRVVDIDILLYGDVVLKRDEEAGFALEIPHPRFTMRRYDLVPFAEIAPSVVHPIFKKTIAELLAECKDRSDVHRFIP